MEAEQEKMDSEEGNLELCRVLVVTNPPVGPEPLHMACPHCKKYVLTKIKKINSAKTHLVCIILTMMGCVICAPCVYCNDSCLAREHICPNCKKYLGTYDG